MTQLKKGNVPDNDRVRVSVASLQISLSFPQAIAGSTTLSQVKFPGIIMEFSSLGLYVEHKGVKAIIPTANIQVVIAE